MEAKQSSSRSRVYGRKLWRSTSVCIWGYKLCYMLISGEIVTFGASRELNCGTIRGLAGSNDDHMGQVGGKGGG